MENRPPGSSWVLLAPWLLLAPAGSWKLRETYQNARKWAKIEENRAWSLPAALTGVRVSQTQRKFPYMASKQKGNSHMRLSVLCRKAEAVSDAVKSACDTIKPHVWRRQASTVHQAAAGARRDENRFPCESSVALLLQNQVQQRHPGSEVLAKKWLHHSN